MAAFKYKWLSVGDIGASATIVFDNLTLLTFVASILKFGYNFPTDIIMYYILPGTIIGVLISNCSYLLLTIYLARKQEKNVTAIPSGLDAPSAIGFVVCIIGPAFILFKQQPGITLHYAAYKAWCIGSGCLFLNGLIKFIASFFIHRLKSIIPSAALLGGIGGVAVGLIGFFSLESIFTVPIVGLISLGLIFITMLAHVRLPFNFPGVPAAIIIGSITYYILMPFGLSGTMPSLNGHVQMLLPLPNLYIINNLTYVFNYIPVIVPFALLVIFGTMSVDESAVKLGENYGVRNLAIIDGLATMIGAIFGGVVQTTPYAGLPAYKKMDARAGFLVINIIVVGVGGIFGIVNLIVSIIPEAAVAPVLLYVAFEISMQGFVQCDKKYVAPILFAFFPNIAHLVQIKISSGDLIAIDKLQQKLFTIFPRISDYLIITILGNGFIVTGILWAAYLCFLIDCKWILAFICALILSILSYFGVIHSLFLTSSMFLPSQLPLSVRAIPMQLSVGYLCLGVLALSIGIFKKWTVIKQLKQ